ncbi:MAG: platelet-activating factor acetylhydrolase IB subunit [Planctomycetota bacterium]|jgi:beta-glucosidase
MRTPELIDRAVVTGFVAIVVAVPVSATAKEQAPRQSAAVTPQARPDAWWVERHEKINTRAKKGDIDLIWLGDSITQGWESAGKGVWQKYYGNRRTANMGISGDQTQHVLWRLEHGNVEGISPKVAVIMIGTNNSNGGDYTHEEIAQGVLTIVQSVREKLPQTRVLLLAIFPRGQYPDAQREKIAAVNSTIAKSADGRMVRYLDIGDRFLDGSGRISREIMPDFLHLSPAGYEIWAKSIELVLVEMLGQKSSSE